MVQRRRQKRQSVVMKLCGGMSQTEAGAPVTGLRPPL